MADLTEMTMYWRDVQDDDDRLHCRRWARNNCGCAQLIAAVAISLFGMVTFISGYCIGKYNIF